jgi:hypothetical protein
LKYNSKFLLRIDRLYKEFILNKLPLANLYLKTKSVDEIFY